MSRSARDMIWDLRRAGTRNADIATALATDPALVSRWANGQEPGPDNYTKLTAFWREHGTEADSDDLVSLDLLEDVIGRKQIIINYLRLRRDELLLILVEQEERLRAVEDKVGLGSGPNSRLARIERERLIEAERGVEKLATEPATRRG